MAANGKYLRVKNWSKFQHYKARSNPPWIKLYRSITDDYQFGRLSDRNKAHLILLWLFAASHEGSVPHDPAFLRRHLSLQSNPDLKLFIDQGWLLDNASVSCYQDADLEESRVDKNRLEEIRVDKEGQKRSIDNISTSPQDLARALASKMTGKARG